MDPWHTFSPLTTSEKLATSAELGLSRAEAQTRLERYGANELQTSGGKPAWRLLLEQISSLEGEKWLRRLQIRGTSRQPA